MAVEAARARGFGLPRPLRLLVLSALTAYLALSAYVLWRSAVLQPHSDMFEWVARHYQLQADDDWARYLLAPHNLHRVVWTFALIALDIRAFGGTNAPLILSGAICLAGLAWLLGRQAGKAAPAALQLPAAAFAVMLTLMAGNIFDASTPINVNYTHAALFAALAVVLAEGAPGTPFGWRGAAALACAMAAALGNAAGLALWPVLACGAARRRDWRWLTAVLAVGAAFVGLYALGQGGESAAKVNPAARDPLGALLLALTYLALPWTRAALSLAWVGGAAILAMAAAAIAFKGGRKAGPSERVACALILFSVGTAAMAGLGRSGLESPSTVPLRYAVFLAPAHVGFLILALPYLERLWRANRRLTEALIAASVSLMLAQDAAMAVKVIRASDVNRNLIADFQAGRRTPEMSITIHPALSRAEAISTRLRADGLYRHELHLPPRRPPR